MDQMARMVVITCSCIMLGIHGLRLPQKYTQLPGAERPLLNPRTQLHDGPDGAIDMQLGFDDAIGAQFVEESTEDSEEQNQIYFNHLAKCGGSFVKRIIRDAVKHPKISNEGDKMKAADKLKFTVGLIRNPFDYYVSLWAFTSDPKTCCFKRALTKEQDRKTLSNEDSTTGKGSTAEGRKRFREWLKLVNDPKLGTMSLRFYGSYVQYKFTHQKFPKKFNGVTTHDKMVNKFGIGQNLKKFDAIKSLPVNCWIRTESIVDDTKTCLQEFEKNGGVVNWKQFDEGLSDSRFGHNSSPHAKCSNMYDAEATELVEQGDRHLFRLFNYPKHCNDA